MNSQKQLVNVLYGYISFAFFMILLDVFGIFHPIPEILAGVTLLVAAYYVGRYGKK